MEKLRGMGKNARTSIFTITRPIGARAPNDPQNADAVNLLKFVSPAGRGFDG